MCFLYVLSIYFESVEITVLGRAQHSCQGTGTGWGCEARDQVRTVRYSLTHSFFGRSLALKSVSRLGDSSYLQSSGTTDEWEWLRIASLPGQSPGDRGVPRAATFTPSLKKKACRLIWERHSPAERGVCMSQLISVWSVCWNTHVQ